MMYWNGRIALLIVLSVSSSAVAKDRIVGVASVIDGDTIEIRGQRIRLFGIDAPESSQLCERPTGARWRCGQQASFALADRIGRATVSCQPRDLDRYGRIVAVCFNGNEDLNRWMVAPAGPSHSGDIHWITWQMRLAHVAVGSISGLANSRCRGRGGRGTITDDATDDMNPQPEAAKPEVLAGLVERVTYHNSETGFCVLRAKARGHRDMVTVVGHAATIAAGEWITASGDWVNDRTHGQQFKARFLRTSPPTSADGIEKYLSSGMIRGVGPVYAKKLVRAFGDKVFDIIEASPDRLREVEGIGPVRAASILSAWAEQKAVREIMVFLHSHGVGTARAVRIFKTYGGDAVQVMTENPYRLARDIRGIGFKTADAIAMKLGIDKTAMVRVRAGISYALAEAMDEGHCGLPTDELVPLTEKLLEVPEGLVRTALDLELAEGTVIAERVGETPCIFLTGLYRAERTIAERTHAACQRRPAVAVD